MSVFNSAYGRKTPWGDGTITWTRDASLNDSNKTFTVPAGKVWWLLGVYVSLIASADVGNRVVTMRIATSAGDIVVTTVPSPSITASSTGGIACYYGSGEMGDTTIFDRLSDGAASTASMQSNTALGFTLLTAGMTVTVLDRAAIAAAADDMTVVLYYIEYDA